MSQDNEERKPIYVRLGINLVKVTAVLFTMLILLGLRLLNTENDDFVVHWAIISILSIALAVSLIDILLESIDIAVMIIALLIIISIIVITIDISVTLFLGAKEGFVPLIIPLIIFGLLQLILSLNDAGMEESAAYYFYPRDDTRHGSFISHLIFNAVPYVIGFYGINYTLKMYSPRSAIFFTVGLALLLYSFAIFDEFSRRKWHWSLLWHNKPINI